MLPAALLYHKKYKLTYQRQPGLVGWGGKVDYIRAKIIKLVPGPDYGWEGKLFCS